MPHETSVLLIEALRGVLSQVAEPVHVLRTILKLAVLRTGADRGAFVEIQASGAMDYRVLHRFDPADLTSDSGSFSRAILAEVQRTGEAVLVESAMEDARFLTSDSVQGLKLGSVLSVPLRVQDRIAALIHLERDRSGHFTREHLDVLRSLVNVAEPLLEALRSGNKVLEERARLRDVSRVFMQELNENREVLSREWSFGRFVGRSLEVRSLEDRTRKVAATDLPVLIEGETGTGKSLLARILHHLGARSKHAFVTVFCPSLAPGMVETTLFGHRRGAFTGAVSDRIGKVQAAEGGTLFLDEVGELPIEIQPKLLRLLHEKVYERVGDHQERTADARVVAATNKDLATEVREGRFRRDLYERLRFVTLRLPTVRERRDDIPLLLRYALDRFDSGRWLDLSDEAAAFLVEVDYAWPGNVREIEQLAARLVMESVRGEPLSPTAVERQLGIRGEESVVRPVPPPRDAGLPELVESAEKEILRRALRENPDLSRAELAAKLRISERALYKKLRLFELGG